MAKKNGKAVRWTPFCLSRKTLALCFQDSGEHAVVPSGPASQNVG